VARWVVSFKGTLSQRAVNALAAAGTPRRSEQRGGFTAPGAELPISSHKLDVDDADSADDAIARVQKTLKPFGSFGDFDAQLRSR